MGATEQDRHKPAGTGLAAPPDFIAKGVQGRCWGLPRCPPIPGCYAPTTSYLPQGWALPPWLSNLQTLCQLVEPLLLSKTLIYLTNAMTNDKTSVYSGLFVTSCGANVLGKQCLIPLSANKMAFSVVFTGRAHFLWVSLLWRYWEMFCGRYLHSTEFQWHPPSALDTGLGPRLPEDERALCWAPYQFVVLTEWRDYFSMAGKAG